MPSSTLILTDSLKTLFIDTARRLKGTDRRQFMAQVFQELGVGGQSLAERDLGWNQVTIRKGMKELTGGIAIQDSFHLRGRKSTEEKFPNLLKDIQEINGTDLS